MLAHSLIVVPAIFTLQFTLVTPPEILNSGHPTRHLALDMFTQPRDGAHSRELNRGSQIMASLTTLFPNLESCVAMVHLSHNTFLAHPNLNGELDLLGSARECLRFRNIKKASNIITLEEMLVEFIAAYLKHGPGKRKFLRFAHSDCRNSSLKVNGPLVRVGVQEPVCGLLSTEELTTEEFQDNYDAKRILQEAYWAKDGPLGDWAVSFREQQV